MERMLWVEKEMEWFHGPMRLALGVSVIRRWRVQGWQGWLIKNVKRPKCSNNGYVCGIKVWEWSDMIWCVSIGVKLRAEMASARVKEPQDMCEICWVDSCKVYLLISDLSAILTMMVKACTRLQVGGEDDECKVDRDDKWKKWRGESVQILDKYVDINFENDQIRFDVSGLSWRWKERWWVQGWRGDWKSVKIGEWIVVKYIYWIVKRDFNWRWWIRLALGWKLKEKGMSARWTGIINEKCKEAKVF